MCLTRVAHPDFVMVLRGNFQGVWLVHGARIAPLQRRDIFVGVCAGGGWECGREKLVANYDISQSFFINQR